MLFVATSFFSSAFFVDRHSFLIQQYNPVFFTITFSNSNLYFKAMKKTNTTANFNINLNISFFKIQSYNFKNFFFVFRNKILASEFYLSANSIVSTYKEFSDFRPSKSTRGTFFLTFSELSTFGSDNLFSFFNFINPPNAKTFFFHCDRSYCHFCQLIPLFILKMYFSFFHLRFLNSVVSIQHLIP